MDPSGHTVYHGGGTRRALSTGVDPSHAPTTSLPTQLSLGVVSFDSYLWYSRSSWFVGLDVPLPHTLPDIPVGPGFCQKVGYGRVW